MAEPIGHTIEDEADVVNTVLLWRIYDVLSVLLASINPQDWEAVMKAHEQGSFITPQPAFRVGES